MFSLSTEPLLLSEAAIHGLCVSLNAPVLNIADLPVGPARAAVVLYDCGYGTLALALGVRSIETRQVAVYAYRGTVEESEMPSGALEVATRFGEHMGFLFDEDVVDAADPETHGRALGLWTDAAGAPELGEWRADEAPQVAEAPAPLALPVPLAGEPDELVLEDLLAEGNEAGAPTDGGELWLDELSEPAPAAASAVAADPPNAIPLAKFRRSPNPGTTREAAAVSTDPVPAGALGRIALIRRGSEGRRPGPLLRLLGTF